MNILVLGGTGSIGRGIVRALLARNHHVIALARSESSARTLAQSGAIPCMGDIKTPETWIQIVDTSDGVVHVADTWDDDMKAIDNNLIDSLINAMKRGKTPKALIYTGGCWLYGNTADKVADEQSPFDVMDQFAGNIDVIQRVLSTQEIRGMVIHPAMVYEKGGGVFSHIYEDAGTLGYVRVIASEDIRWPLIHVDDLGLLYVLMLENGLQGDSYNAATIEGYRVGKIIRGIARQLGIHEVPEILSMTAAIEAYGSIAEGYAIDQQMSGHKAREQLNWQPTHIDPLIDIG